VSNAEVQLFIAEQPAPQRRLLSYLDQLLIQQGLTSKIRYKIPFYDHYSWICYLNPIKNAGIELAFVQGKELSNEQRLLEARDRKQIMGIRIYSIETIPEQAITEIVQEAMLLDEYLRKG
jgi:hypothetical protein